MTERNARFGVFELDVQTGELRRDGVKVRLQEQPFRLLSMLLERPGEVVTREELRERLWPAEFVDFDHSLNAAIRKLRTALDDAADNPRFIETLARRGYRFIAPVSWSSDRVVAQPPSPRRLPLIGVAIAALVVIVAVVLVRQRMAPAHETVSAIAVLPFTNQDARTEYVSDGLTEILIDQLSRLPDLRVMARTSVFRFKGKTMDPKSAGNELKVAAVVVGNVRPEPDGYAIHVELVDVRDGTQIWGSQYHTRAADLPLAQSWIADDLSRELRRGLDPTRRRALARSYTRSSQAYDLYLKGLYAWNKRTRDDLEASIRYFKQALDLDPQLAAAYAGLANAYGVMTGYGILPAKDGVIQVTTAARKALELDPANAEAYTSLATTKFRNFWDFPGAEHDYRRALALNPNYATGHQWYADYLWSMGRWTEARREIDTAYKLDPFSMPITSAMCWSLVTERRYRDAIAFDQRAEKLDPRFANGPCVYRAYLGLGENDAAAAGMIRSVPNPAAATALANAYRKSGRRGMIAMIQQYWIQQQGSDSSTPVAIAATYAELGNKDEAFAWLEKAYEQRVSRLTSFHVDPVFDPLRSDPRYDDLLRRIGLPHPPVIPPDASTSKP